LEVEGTLRILFIQNHFDPEPTSKGLALARALKDLGHEVEVITGFPNYPGGNVYPGYRIKPFQIDIMDGVRVVRVPLYPSHDGSGLKRALNYLTFMLSSLIIGGVLTRRPDVIYAYHPPLTTGISVVLLGVLKGAPFVYDIQDLWPDTIAATGVLSSPRALQVIENVCQWVYARARNIIVLSNGFKTRLEERGVPAGKVTVIPNWADESQIQLEDDPDLRRDLGVGERFNIVFAGTMGKAQALESVLEVAATLLVSEPRVQFVFVGGGVELPHLQQIVQEKGLSNVRFLARRPMSEIGRVLACADALLVHLKDDAGVLGGWQTGLDGGAWRCRRNHSRIWGWCLLRTRKSVQFACGNWAVVCVVQTGSGGDGPARSGVLRDAFGNCRWGQTDRGGFRGQFGLEGGVQFCETGL
jgi:colanic acid biosynthesis glycosyl transferase WcaI